MRSLAARRTPPRRRPRSRYLAPEVHANDAYDGRADVFSVGVLLWEVLEGKRLSNDGEEPAGVRVRSAPLPAPQAPEGTPWSKALVPVVTRALAAAPEDRWPTAAAMAAEIRKAAGLKLAAASAAAAFAKNKFGDRAKERRVRWESRPSRPPGAAPISAARLRSARRSFAARSTRRRSSRASGLRRPRSRRRRGFDAPFASGWDWEPPSAEVPVVANITAPVAARPEPEPPRPAPQAAEAVAPAVAPVVAPSDAPGMAQVDALVEHASDDVPLDPPGAGLDSAFSIPPLEPPAFAIPEPPPSAEAAVPVEAPVVFDEADVGPVRAPFGDASPMPPALSSSGAPSGGRSRRRQALIAGVAALGIGAASLIAVRASHHAAPPAVAAMPAASPPAALTASPAVASAASNPGPVASSATVAAPAPPAPAAAPHAASPKSKGAKTKAPAAAGQHGKSGAVRPAPRSKPGAT